MVSEHESGQVAVSAAEVYEEFFVPALFAEWPARVLQSAAVQNGDAVLDVACGTGILAREAVKRVGASGSVVGIDTNEGMLAVARRKAADISWKAAPAENLPFDARSFDRVVSQFGLMFFDDQRRALQEMVRVLRPGGTMAVAVWGSLAATPGYAAVAEILADLFGPEIAKSIEVPYALGEIQALASLFAKAGLDKVRIETIYGKARFSSVAAWIYTDIRGWTLADVIDDEGFARLSEYASERLAQFAQPDGAVIFDAPAHIAIVQGH